MNGLKTSNPLNSNEPPFTIIADSPERALSWIDFSIIYICTNAFNRKPLPVGGAGRDTKRQDTSGVTRTYRCLSSTTVSEEEESRLV